MANIIGRDDWLLQTIWKNITFTQRAPAHFFQHRNFHPSQLTAMASSCLLSAIQTKYPNQTEQFVMCEFAV